MMLKSLIGNFKMENKLKPSTKLMTLKNWDDLFAKNAKFCA